MLSCCWFAIITPKTLASVSCRGAPPPALNQQGLRTWTRRFHPQPIGPVPGAACDQRKLRLLNPPYSAHQNYEQCAATRCAELRRASAPAWSGSRTFACPRCSLRTSGRRQRQPSPETQGRCTPHGCRTAVPIDFTMWVLTSHSVTGTVGSSAYNPTRL